MSLFGKLSQAKKMKCPVFEVTEEPKWFSPTCVILLKGERGSGVSTVFNLLFQTPTRLISSSTALVSSSFSLPSSSHDEGHEPVIANITDRPPRIKSEDGSNENNNEIDFPHNYLEDLFPGSFNQKIAYKFIESGNLSEDWYDESNIFSHV